MKYSNGKYVALSDYSALAIPKPVEKEDAYLFTPNKAKVYWEHYKDQFELEIVDVDVYLD